MKHSHTISKLYHQYKMEINLPMHGGVLFIISNFMTFPESQL